ncbi:hypothetical protein FACS1894201_06900 [Bacteroidia bacterium]|nr:hypothetical protein FACS1894201_06900 [Bacteroidia bacterium]
MDLKKIIASLSKAEQVELVRLLQYELNVPKLAEIHCGQSKDAVVHCTHCGSADIYGHGTYKGRRRYQCKCCRTTFNDFTGTAVSGIKKVAKFQEYINLVLESVSIRKAASTLDINIKTAFDWRHKILSALSTFNGASFDGIVECDDKQLDINEKGSKHLNRKPYKRQSDRHTKRGVSNDKVSVMVATDRKGNPTMQAAKVGRIDAASIEASIGKYISKDNVLCSDSHKSIISWALSKNIEHHTFVASKQHVKDKCYHVQHVNSLDNRYERWIKRFYGVATKYIANYLHWFVCLEKLKKASQRATDMARIILSNIKAMADYRNIEASYQNLNIIQYSKT